MKYAIVSTCFLCFSFTPTLFSQQIPIQDVQGLTNELSLRPSIGSAFVTSRAAVIDNMGQIDGAMGSMTDCLHVDGSSGPCSPNSIAFVDAETPGGVINGQNAVFTLQQIPSPAASLNLFRDGLHLELGVDYTAAGNQITFAPASLPQPGDQLVAYYRLGLSGGSSPASKMLPQPGSMAFRLLLEQANADDAEGTIPGNTLQNTAPPLTASTHARLAPSLALLRDLGDSASESNSSDDPLRHHARSAGRKKRSLQSPVGSVAANEDDDPATDVDEQPDASRPKREKLLNRNAHREVVDKETSDDDATDELGDQESGTSRLSIPASTSWKTILRNANPVNLIRNAGGRQ